MPEALQSVPHLPTGKLWWEVDLPGIMAKMFAGQLEQVFQMKPAGLDSARKLILDLVATVQNETNLPTSRIILGGFSQVRLASNWIQYFFDECS